jgi:ribose transport system ATP-binding protein
MRASSSQSALLVSHLSKTFEGQKALNDVGITVQPGEVRALLGQNGCGKSTLIKVLAGYHHPDLGADVLIAGEPLTFGSPRSAFDLGCRFVHQDLGLLPSLTVADNLAFTGGFPMRVGTIRAREARRRAEQDLERAGVHADPASAVRELSPATQTGIVVARALKNVEGHPARLLVLDEPTAALTGDDVATLLDVVRRVAASGVGVLYVSHQLDEVFKIADSVTVLRDGNDVPAPPVAELDHRRLVSLLVGDKLRELESATGDQLVGRGAPILQVKGLASGVISDVSFAARSGEILGVAGVDGSGRELLLSAIFGGARRTSGQVTHDGAALPSHRPDVAVKSGVAYLPADRRAHGGFAGLSAAENIAISDLRPFWTGYRIRRSAQRAVSREWFERLQIRPRDAATRDLVTFSGGNQQKVLLAKWLRCKPDTLLLEEPTHGVDVAAKVELHKAIIAAADSGTCVVVSSSDTDELVTLCHRVLVLRRGRVACELSGSDLTTLAVSHEMLGDSSLAGVAGEEATCASR